MVSRRASERLIGKMDCTRPFPKVVVPSTNARSWSCNAPAMISDALAENSFTNTTTGIPLHSSGVRAS